MSWCDRQTSLTWSLWRTRRRHPCFVRARGSFDSRETWGYAAASSVCPVARSLDTCQSWWQLQTQAHWAPVPAQDAPWPSQPHQHSLPPVEGKDDISHNNMYTLHVIITMVFRVKYDIYPFSSFRLKSHVCVSSSKLKWMKLAHIKNPKS